MSDAATRDAVLAELAREVREARRRARHAGREPGADAGVLAALDRVAERVEALRRAGGSGSAAAAPALPEAWREPYRSVFQAAPDAYLITSAAGLIREANRAACRLLGSGVEGVVGRLLRARVLPDDRARFEALLAEAGAAGRRDDVELRLLADADRTVSVSVSVVEAPAEPGVSGTLLWLLRDVTARARADESERRLLLETAARAEAEAAQQRISNILESISDGFVALDHDARVTYANRRAEQLLARPRERMLGRVGWEIFPELLGTAFEREYHRVRDSGVPLSLEEFYRPARAWIELHAVPSPDGLTIYFRNITARKQAESRDRFLADATARLVASIDYETTLDTVVRLPVPLLADSCILYVLDDDGTIHRARCAHRDPDGEAQLREVLRLMPRDPHVPDSPVGRVLDRGVPEVIQEVSPSFLESLAQTPEHREAIQRVAPHSLMVLPLISRGRTFGVLSLGRIDRETRYGAADAALAEELAQRAALALDNARLYAAAKEAARVRQEILHVVSHDLRNSLNASMLHIELIEHGMASSPAAGQVEQQIEAIRRSAQHMHRLVQDLLDAENIELGRLSLERRECQVRALVDEVLQSVRPMADAKPLELRRAVEPTAPAVLADHERVLQVLSNVVGNAIKFTPGGGQVEVGAEPQPDASMIRFWVRDTGPGIAEAELPRIFERHWQGGHAASAGRGAGLGLTIARGIVEAHGGCMWAESAEGEGSTFFFTLPAPESGAE